MRLRKASCAGVYFWELWNFDAAGELRTIEASILLPRARNCAHRIYSAVTLFAGYVFFNEVGVLQPHEFDGKAIVDVTHNAALRLSDGDHDADWRSQLARDSQRRGAPRQND